MLTVKLCRRSIADHETRGPADVIGYLYRYGIVERSRGGGRWEGLYPSTACYLRPSLYVTNERHFLDAYSIGAVRAGPVLVLPRVVGLPRALGRKSLVALLPEGRVLERPPPGTVWGLPLRRRLDTLYELGVCHCSSGDAGGHGEGFDHNASSDAGDQINEKSDMEIGTVL